MSFKHSIEIQTFCQIRRVLFYKNKVCFLSYIISAQRVKIEDK